MITIEGNDEVARQLKAMRAMQNGLQELASEIESIVQAAVQSDFSIKMNVNGKMGYTKDLTELLNGLMPSLFTARENKVERHRPALLVIITFFSRFRSLCHVA